MKKDPVHELWSIAFGKPAREILPDVWTFLRWVAVVLAIPARIFFPNGRKVHAFEV